MLAGTGPLSESLRRSDPYPTPNLSGSPMSLAQQHFQHAHSAQHAQQGLHAQHPQQTQHAQQPQQAQHAQHSPQAQHAQQAQQPIKVSLLPDSQKLMTPAQVKELSWQNHLKIYKVCRMPAC